MGFHVPRITISFDFEKSSSFGELSLISLGYGLHQAWIYSSMFDKGGIFGAHLLEAGAFTHALSLAYFVSILVYGLLLLVAAVLDTRLVRFLHSAPVLAGAAVLGTAGTMLLMLPGQSPLDTRLLQICSGVLTGAGSSVLLLAWGVMFARRDSASIVINGALSIAIGFGVYGLVLHQTPFPFGGVLSALIPLMELALLLLLRRHVSLDFDNRRLIFQPLPINHARFVLRFGVPVFFLGVALGILRQTSIETILPGAGFDDQAILFLTACGAMVLIMITFLALGGDERWHTFFRPLIPFVAVTALFIPSASGSDALWATTVVLLGYMTFEALMWIFFAELSQRFRVSPIFVFGLGRGVMALAALGGTILPVFGGGLVLPQAFGDMGAVMLVILAMMVAFALLPDERELAYIMTVNPRRSGRASVAARTPLIVVNESVRETELKAHGAENDATPDTTNEDDSNRAGAAIGDAEVSAEIVAASAGTLVAPSAPSATLSPISESTPAPTPEPSEARRAMDFSRSIFADDIAEAAIPAEDDSPDTRGRFRERCEAVANTYLLSRRENEVMYYLARGYKSSYIQQQLYISEGTAKTHIRHIYRKLNIHSQQELIQLIDSVEL